MFNPKKAGETDDTAVTNLNTATIWQRVVSSAQQLRNKVGQGQQYTTSANNNGQSSSTTGVTNDNTGKPLASSTSSAKTYGTGK